MNGGAARQHDGQRRRPPTRRTWSCRLAGTFTAGTNVTVQELIPAGAEVDFIDTDPGANLVDFNTQTGTAIVKITGPVTMVLFDNEPIPPPQSGYIEVCKDALGGVIRL